MIVFYDPHSGNQVMAIYSHDTSSSAVWTDRGYVRAEVDSAVVEKASRLGRDAKATVSKGRVTNVVAATNAVQPTPSPKNKRLEELRAKLKDDTATLVDMREMLRLERGL